MNIIANGKATSDDKIMDIIFDKKQYHKLKIMGAEYEDEILINEATKKEWAEHIHYLLAKTLQEYYNYIIINNLKLIAN